MKLDFYLPKQKKETVKTKLGIHIGTHSMVELQLVYS